MFFHGLDYEQISFYQDSSPQYQGAYFAIHQNTCYITVQKRRKKKRLSTRKFSGGGCFGRASYLLRHQITQTHVNCPFVSHEWCETHVFSHLYFTSCPFEYVIDLIKWSKKNITSFQAECIVQRVYSMQMTDSFKIGFLSQFCDSKIQRKKLQNPRKKSKFERKIWILSFGMRKMIGK